MTMIHSALFILHILFGTTALILFWVPLFTEKGRLNHVKFGRYYKNTMYTVAASGALMALMVIAMPLVIKADVLSENADMDKAAYNLRVFWSFLFYLSILSFTGTRHAIAVLNVKDNRQQLRTVGYLFPIVLLTAGGPFIFYLGYAFNQTLHMIFGVLGLLVGASMLRYCLQKEIKNRQWIIEHIGAMMGSGIGAYTASLAFGGRTVLGDLGQWQLLFWVAPGVIGSVISAVFCKKYKLIFQIKKPAIS
ncbi:MAG: hypothetical protein ACI97K_001069 [Glaciecola sp.]|jgi:hypothetical protein